jgi:carboxypeptidase Taq
LLNEKKIIELKKRITDATYLASVLNMLSWDQEVMMSPKGAELRAQTVAAVSGLLHEKILAINHDALLTNLKHLVDQGKIKNDDAVIVKETWRLYERKKKLPDAFVREMAETISRAFTIWVEARKKSDFKLFQPWLEKIISLKRKEASYVGYSDSPYDALIDEYEPGMTTKNAEAILEDLRNFLVPFIASLKKRKKSLLPKIKGKFLIPDQIKLNNFIAEKLGFDLSAGRIDVSAHPFTTNFNPHDVRFTTSYNDTNLWVALGATIHETGHALYEQGLSAKHFGTPLAEAISLGIHESQSRLYENIIGKSKAFWHYFYPELKKRFPQLKKISATDFYESITRVEPSLIRTESDEVTYNLHIIIRFEIERALIESKLKVKDVPKVWNEKVKHYLGISVPDDAHGVLQDMHWASGGVGYFPTYSFGNLYSAQFYKTMERQIPNLSQKIADSEFKPIQIWLGKNIHIHGKRYSAAEIIKKVTGEPLTSRYFIDYLKEKYGQK